MRVQVYNVQKTEWQDIKSDEKVTPSQIRIWPRDGGPAIEVTDIEGEGWAIRSPGGTLVVEPVMADLMRLWVLDRLALRRGT